jgi:hypothetical protein
LTPAGVRDIRSGAGLHGTLLALLLLTFMVVVTPVVVAVATLI